jgi:hypothetical protein
MLNFIKTEKAWILSHLVWIVAVAVALVVGHIALTEHDQRVAAEAAMKISEANVSQLQAQIKNTDNVAAQKVQTIVKIVHDLGPNATPGQIVAAVPQLTDAPLNARVIANDPANISVAAVPFLQFLQTSATNSVLLGACQSDLKNETAIVGQKQDEITALKKKPSFISRVKHVAEAVGVGIAIGILLK